MNTLYFTERADVVGKVLKGGEWPESFTLTEQHPESSELPLVLGKPDASPEELGQVKTIELVPSPTFNPAPFRQDITRADKKIPAYSGISKEEVKGWKMRQPHQGSQEQRS